MGGDLAKVFELKLGSCLHVRDNDDDNDDDDASSDNFQFLKPSRVRKLGDEKTKVLAVFPKEGGCGHPFNETLRSRSYNCMTSVLILLESYSGHLTEQILSVEIFIK